MQEIDKKPEVVILTPVYNEEKNIDYYVEQVTRVLFSRSEYLFKVIFIDDGSMDRSWELISEVAERDSRFTGIRLSRNFGSHIALSAGSAHAQGDCVCILACDLQDPPEVILQFLEKWKQGYDIVWGRRRSRQENGWRVLASNIFYKLTARYAMPRNSKFTTGSFLLMDKKVLDSFQQFSERNRITFALVAWTGFTQAVVDYDRLPRRAGVSGWSFGRMIKAMYDTFMGFSGLPAQTITLLGVAVFLLSIGLSLYVIINKLSGTSYPGWTSLFIVISFFFGILFLALGVLTEYLYRIYVEVLHRPLYFIRDRAGLKEDNQDACFPFDGDRS